MNTKKSTSKIPGLIKILWPNSVTLIVIPWFSMCILFGFPILCRFFFSFVLCYGINSHQLFNAKTSFSQMKETQQKKRNTQNTRGRKTALENWSFAYVGWTIVGDVCIENAVWNEWMNWKWVAKWYRWNNKIHCQESW